MSSTPEENDTNTPDVTTIYKRLDAARCEIRILWLLPPDKEWAFAQYTKSNGKADDDDDGGTSATTSDDKDEDQDEYDDDSPIRAVLTTASLLDKPSYNALSYT